MPPADEHRGLALVAAPDGTIIRTIRDDIGVLPSLVPGATLAGLMDRPSAFKTANFLAAVNEGQAAFDWEMTLLRAGRPMLMRFAGAVVEPGVLMITGTRTSPGLAAVKGELTSISNEQNNALRAALKELSLQPRDHQRDRHLYDDLSRLNNELANLEREMVRKNVELEKSNAQKNRILGMAAHDLRSPLGVIQSYSEFLEEEAGDVLNEEQREFVAVIKESSEFLLKMITDILDVTAIEAGQLKLERQPADLVALIRHNLTLNRVLAHRKGIAVELDPLPELPLLPIDAGKIDQVLNNLVGNAVKFSHTGTIVRVHLTLTNERVTIAVADEGQGIPAQDLSTLFKPFGKGSVRGTAGEQSTGLGLAIVRNIVEGHGGRIWLETEVGRGSTFFFTLPLS